MRQVKNHLNIWFVFMIVYGVELKGIEQILVEIDLIIRHTAEISLELISMSI